MTNSITLTSYQKKVYKNYKKTLEILSLNADSFLESIDNSEREAITPTIVSMMEQVIRSEVIMEYTYIDMELDYLILFQFFGTGKKLVNARRTKKYRILKSMLESIYLIKKLDIVRSFVNMPKDIVNKIYAINELRNGLAHSFFVNELKPAKRTYKRKNIFSLDGLQEFKNDMNKISDFFLEL